ncbi:hypothetical protein JTS97_13440 [Clostridium botulinum]|nr:hypothetical protein [Clostridium botulinum]
MFVDSSVYRNDYIDKEDLDLIQSIWVEEDKRIKQENIREKNEESRVSNESIREKMKKIELIKNS